MSSSPYHSQPPPPYEQSHNPLDTTTCTNDLDPAIGNRWYQGSPGMQRLSISDEKEPMQPQLTPEASRGSLSTASRADSQRSLRVPCVIPQMKGSRNAFMTPFVRAYAPELANHGISKPEFVTFIDGLNEAFLSNPVLQGTNLVGMALSQLYGLHTVQMAGGIIQGASGLGSAAISYGRTRMYVKAMNENLFNPAGLHVNVLSTKKLLQHIGYPEEELPRLPMSFDSASTATASPETEQETESPSGPDNTIVHRMQTLEGYCQPLDYDVPPNAQPDNLLKRMGNAQAARLTRRHEEKLRKDYEKAEKQDGKKDQEAEKERHKFDRRTTKTERRVEKRRSSADEKISKIEDKIAAEKSKLDRKLSSSRVQRDPKETEKVQKDHDKEIKKLQKDLDKEIKDFEKERAKLEEEDRRESRKIKKDKAKESGKSEKAKLQKKEAKGVKKIRWIVISRLEDGEGESEDELPSAEEEEGMRLST